MIQLHFFTPNPSFHVKELFIFSAGLTLAVAVMVAAMMRFLGLGFPGRLVSLRLCLLGGRFLLRLRLGRLFTLRLMAAATVATAATSLGLGLLCCGRFLLHCFRDRSRLVHHSFLAVTELNGL
jgi:hypothetical protein